VYLLFWFIFIPADGSRVSIDIIHLSDSVCDSVCVSVCVSVILSISLHDKTKMAETKIAILGTGIVHHHTSPTNEY